MFYIARHVLHCPFCFTLSVFFYLALYILHCHLYFRLPFCILFCSLHFTLPFMYFTLSLYFTLPYYILNWYVYFTYPSYFTLPVIFCIALFILHCLSYLTLPFMFYIACYTLHCPLYFILKKLRNIMHIMEVHCPYGLHAAQLFSMFFLHIFKIIIKNVVSWGNFPPTTMYSRGPVHEKIRMKKISGSKLKKLGQFENYWKGAEWKSILVWPWGWDRRLGWCKPGVGRPPEPYQPYHTIPYHTIQSHT